MILLAAIGLTAIYYCCLMLFVKRKRHQFAQTRQAVIGQSTDKSKEKETPQAPKIKDQEMTDSAAAATPPHTLPTPKETTEIRPTREPATTFSTIDFPQNDAEDLADMEALLDENDDTNIPDVSDDDNVQIPVETIDLTIARSEYDFGKTELANTLESFADIPLIHENELLQTLDLVARA